MTKKKISFEKAMAELASLVDELEAGNLTLDEALKTFEKGVGLTRQCQADLQHAEQKVQILLNSSTSDAAGESPVVGSDEMDADRFVLFDEDVR